jgi:predicted glycoside hydrolase/deacetylase ChbG (UPF0249 family)
MRDGNVTPAAEVAVELHADDYALSAHNSARILSLLEQGVLDGISIIPNMHDRERCMEELARAWDGMEHKPHIAVHLNIADGRSLSGISDPLLTHEGSDGARYFRTSWMKLLFASHLPRRREQIRRELTGEFVLQIRGVYDRIAAFAADADGNCPFGLDSHTHTHMIPVVFDAMLDAVRETGLTGDLRYVRVSREPAGAFGCILYTVSPVNLIKNVLLNLLSGRAEKRLDRLGISHGLLWGLIMSGRMDAERTGRVLPGMLRRIREKKMPLEILFHPGIVLPEEAAAEEYTPSDLAAVISADRDTEYESVCAMRGMLSGGLR